MSEHRFEILIAEPDTKLRTRLVSQLGEDVVSTAAASVAELEGALDASVASVVIFGPGFADLAGLADIERITRTRPQIAAILIVDELSTNLLQQALRAGVRDVVPGPTEPQQLAESVARVSDGLNVVQGRVVSTILDTDDQCRVIAVASMKGGSGKSVVATNLAVALSRRSARPVALIDADLQFGDVAVLLKLTPKHTLVDAVGSIGRLDAHLIQSILTSYEPTGLLVLPAPIEPAFAEQISPDDIVKIATLMRQFCSFVVIDTPAVLNEIVVGLVEHADDVVVVAGTDIPNVKNVKLGLQTLNMLNVDLGKFHLAMNGAGGRSRLDLSEVERTLQMKAACVIPTDIAVPQSVNKGVPVVLSAPRSAPARALEHLADRFAGSAQPAPVATSKKGLRAAAIGSRS